MLRDDDERIGRKIYKIGRETSLIALSDKSWLIEQTTLTADPHMETCLTLANGYLGVRGTHEEMLAYEGYGTYVAGIFDQSEAQVTELVNLPYFFGLELYVNGAKLDLERGKVLDCYRALDTKQASCTRRPAARIRQAASPKLKA